MSGCPGSGKSMMAKRLPSILPDMTRGEALACTEIYSVMAGHRAQPPVQGQLAQEGGVPLALQGELPPGAPPPGAGFRRGEGSGARQAGLGGGRRRGAPCPHVGLPRLGQVHDGQAPAQAHRPEGWPYQPHLHGFMAHTSMNRLG